MTNTLYNELIENKQYSDAYLVIKNLLSKNTSNAEIFKEFIDRALWIADLPIVTEERKQYISEANSALAIFSESADIDAEILSLIKETRDRISKSYLDVCNAEAEKYESENKKISKTNSELLDKLADLCIELDKVQMQSQFDKKLAEAAEIESKIDTESLSIDQSKVYNSLTQTYSNVVSSKMEELNRASLLRYNKDATLAFHNVFKNFTADKSKYKKESSLKMLMTTSFFIYDTSKLFNETLVYYNHVYSTIFQEVSDDLKFKLTEWALTSQKK